MKQTTTSPTESLGCLCVDDPRYSGWVSLSKIENDARRVGVVSCRCVALVQDDAGVLAVDIRGDVVLKAWPMRRGGLHLEMVARPEVLQRLAFNVCMTAASAEGRRLAIVEARDAHGVAVKAHDAARAAYLDFDKGQP